MRIEKANFSEWYNTIIKEAGLCDLRYNLKGFVVFMPWSVKSMKLMYAAFEKELERNGHRSAWFPALIPEENLKSEAEHVEGFAPEVFWVTEAGRTKLEGRYAMRPTSESAIYPMYALWINGARDLPLKIYQSCQVWRHETKATKPFIRSREFHWIETHNCFATEEEAVEQVREDMETTERVMHLQMGIPFIFFRRPQWDKFAGAVDTFAADSILPDGKVLQLPSTHLLGQNFAKAFNVKYTNEKGENVYVWQTCYGPAISRIYAALISVHGDDKGLIIPYAFAPVQVVIVPIYKGSNKAMIDAKAEWIVRKLRDFDIRVEYDASNNTPGFKYNYWEMKGVPIRLELGERELDDNVVVIVRRDFGNKERVPVNELVEKLEVVGRQIDEDLRHRADAVFKQYIHAAGSMKELNAHLDQYGGFVRVPFCSDGMDGEGCAERVKEETKGNVRGSIFQSSEKPSSEKCIACGKKAMIYLYVARQY